MLTCLFGALTAFSLLGLFYYRNKYRKLLMHHRNSAIKWRGIILSIVNDDVGSYFKDSDATNHVISISGEEDLEISIGNDDFQVPVDMKLAQSDRDGAFDEAYGKFMDKNERNL